MKKTSLQNNTLTNCSIFWCFYSILVLFLNEEVTTHSLTYPDLGVCIHLEVEVLCDCICTCPNLLENATLFQWPFVPLSSVIHSFDYFSVGLFSFPYCFILYIFWMLIHHQLNILQILWSICSLFFHSFNGAIWWTKALNFLIFLKAVEFLGLA